jgi:hypothetical protein
MNRKQKKRASPASLNDIKKLEVALTNVIAALLQQSNKSARIIVGVAVSKIAAVCVVTSVWGAIGVFGVASTGTAIATLSGAAATTATLYWIGSTVGLGLAAGGLMLTGGAMVVAIPAMVIAKRHIFGRPRKEDQLSDKEQAVLYASLRLASGLSLACAGDRVPTKAEMMITSEQALRPLILGIEALVGKESDEGETDHKCGSQKTSLALLPRRKLRNSAKKIDRLSRKLMKV